MKACIHVEFLSEPSLSQQISELIDEQETVKNKRWMFDYLVFGDIF